MCCLRQPASYSNTPWSIRPSLWLTENMGWMINKKNIRTEKCTRAPTSINRLPIFLFFYLAGGEAVLLVGQCTRTHTFFPCFHWKRCFHFQLSLMCGKQTGSQQHWVPIQSANGERAAAPPPPRAFLLPSTTSVLLKQYIHGEGLHCIL